MMMFFNRKNKGEKKENKRNDKSESFFMWMKGVQCLGHERDEEALEYFNRSIELDPNHKETYVTKGFLLRVFDRYGEAIKCFLRALEIDPNYKDAMEGIRKTLPQYGIIEEDTITIYSEFFNYRESISKAYYLIYK